MINSPETGATTPCARVLLVDDHPIVRQGMGQLIDRQEDFVVCAEAESIADALAAVERTSPDIAVVDLMLEGGSGIDLIRSFHLQHPALPILVLSMYEERLYADRVLHVGARGYIMKREPPAAILQALRRVLQGDLVFSPAVLEKLLPPLESPDDPKSLDAALARLSDRELEVFQYIRQGYSRRETASVLDLDVKAVNTYCMNILHKLGLEDLTELAPYSISPGQAIPPSPGPEPARYAFSGFQLDTSRRELVHVDHDERIPLEPKVYQVLLYLVQHADRLVTREELLDHVWPDVFVQDAVVSRCIREVRQALGDDHLTQGMIETRPRQGYRFVPSVRIEKT